MQQKSRRGVRTKKNNRIGSSLGYFDTKRREFVITQPNTPTPWINYLGGEEYCAMISNNAGGYSFHKDPRNRRLLRYRYNNVPLDRPGRYLYMRDEATGDFWSATWQPVLKDLKVFETECRHGMGYSRFQSVYKGIESRFLTFVPLDENLEVWTLTLKNISSKPRKLQVFSYVEFCILEAVMDMTDFQYTLNIARASCSNRIIHHSTNYFPEAGKTDLTYFGVSRKLAGYDCDRDAFIGPYHSEANPLAVMEGKSFNSKARGGNPIGSHQIKLKLMPGKEESITFVLGAALNEKESQTALKKYENPKNVDRSFHFLSKRWEEYFSCLSVKTPDPEVDLMVNTWNAYQCRTTFNWSRSASFYESGIGRGMGFRDSNQDTLGVVHAIPDRVRIRLKELLSNQFETGASYHQFFPLTKKGEKGGYSDDPLWLILSTSAYVKETGDVEFLDEKVPYAQSNETETVYEHLCRAVDYVAGQKGPHGLPLIGFADWNDCLNLKGKNNTAESVWVAQFLHWAQRELVRIAHLVGREQHVKKYSELANHLDKLIHQTSWDGEWFIRAFDDAGRPVGSSKNKEGKIDLLTQAWAVISGLSQPERLVRSMDSVKKYLNTRHGLMLIAPPYTSYDPAIGAVGTFAPGLKENGGIFSHANPWAMIAETILGRGDQAMQYYKQLSPATRAKIPHIHRTEVYVYSQFIYGKDHPHFGAARNSWLTGSAAWNFVAITQYILGIRADYEGLVVDPCIPSHWNGFRVIRRFRNAFYDIEIKNPSHVSRGVKEILVDGKPINHALPIPPILDDRTHHVMVVMGRESA